MEDYKRRALEIPGRSAAKERSIKTPHHLHSLLDKTISKAALF
jgi:hypothetical protein